MATLPLTLILYRLCLSETCLKWQRLSKVPPNARCVLWNDFSKQKRTPSGNSQTDCCCLW